MRKFDKVERSRIIDNWAVEFYAFLYFHERHEKKKNNWNLNRDLFHQSSIIVNTLFCIFYVSLHSICIMYISAHKFQISFK